MKVFLEKFAGVGLIYGLFVAPWIPPIWLIGILRKEHRMAVFELSELGIFEAFLLMFLFALALATTFAVICLKTADVPFTPWSKRK